MITITTECNPLEVVSYKNGWATVRAGKTVRKIRIGNKYHLTIYQN